VFDPTAFLQLRSEEDSHDHRLFLQAFFIMALGKTRIDSLSRYAGNEAVAMAATSTL
jgi:hypothetical protein